MRHRLITSPVVLRMDVEVSCCVMACPLKATRPIWTAPRQLSSDSRVT